MLNIITTVIWLPFINVLVKLVKRIIKDDPGQEENKVMYIDHQMLNNAPVAIELTCERAFQNGRADQKR